MHPAPPAAAFSPPAWTAIVVTPHETPRTPRAPASRTARTTHRLHAVPRHSPRHHALPPQVSNPANPDLVSPLPLVPVPPSPTPSSQPTVGTVRRQHRRVQPARVEPGVHNDPPIADPALFRSSADELPTSQSATTIPHTHLDVHSRDQLHSSYLADQLEKHQHVKLAKKKRKPSKRLRSQSSPHVKNLAMKDTFFAYMDEISRENLLNQSQVISLAIDIKNGLTVENTQRTMQAQLGRRPSVSELAASLKLDVSQVQKMRLAGTAAKNSLVASNLRLVTSVAKKVAATKGNSIAGIALDDMVQEGSVGLIRAAEKFDASRGYKFSTYATWWVRAYVMRSITTQSRTIKVPSTIVDEYTRIRKEYAILRENGNFRPTQEEVAQSLGITPAKLRFVINVVTRVPASLDLSLSAAGDATNSRSLGEIIEGDDHVEEKMVEDMQRRELDMALRSCLKPLERAVIRLRFGLDDGQPRTLRETGELLGLSKERIRQLIFRALPKMKTPEIQKMLSDAAAR